MMLLQTTEAVGKKQEKIEPQTATGRWE